MTVAYVSVTIMHAQLKYEYENQYKYEWINEKIFGHK